MIDGLTIVPEFISKSEEKFLIDTIDSEFDSKFSNDEESGPRNKTLSRWTKHYGFNTKSVLKKNDYHSKIPEWLDPCIL